MNHLGRFFKKGLFWLGNLLLFFSLIGIFYLLGPVIKTELQYKLAKPTEKPMEDGLKAPDPYFSIVIPKINAQAKIIANVDATKAKEYLPALQKGVAHAKGTVFPGMKGTVWLFAHSTNSPWNVVRYNAVFYLLRELEPGDEIIIFFNNSRYNYVVTEKKVAARTQTDFFNQRDQELLVLQTCFPPGTTKEALLVFAQRLN